MKLGELRGLIRKTKGNPILKTAALGGVAMTLPLQKSPLLDELERAFPGGKAVETGLTFDEATGLLSSVASGGHVASEPAAAAIIAEDDLLVSDAPAVSTDDDLLV